MTAVDFHVFELVKEEEDEEKQLNLNISGEPHGLELLGFFSSTNSSSLKDRISRAKFKEIKKHGIWIHGDRSSKR